MYDSLIEPELNRLVPPRSEAYQVPTYKDIMQKNLALLHLAEIHMRDHHIPVTPLPLSRGPGLYIVLRRPSGCA